MKNTGKDKLQSPIEILSVKQYLIKEFPFQQGHSAEHAIIKLANKLLISFMKDRFTLDI